MSDVFGVTRGDSPVVLAFPHGGTWLPQAVEAKLNEHGLLRADTDWHTPQLYEGLLPGATRVEARFHRYVIDANRNPSGASLYPGQNTTGLCPRVSFEGKPIYQVGMEPGEEEKGERLRLYHRPYHAALQAELDRVRQKHGLVVLYDCHSIRGEVPFLFEGELPHLNVGTDGGETTSAELQDAVCGVCEAAGRAAGYSWVLNGRFRGGWTTRHYGQPANGVHAVQMELVQSTYMDEAPPFTYQPARAEGIRGVLSKVLSALEQQALTLAASSTKG